MMKNQIKIVDKIFSSKKDAIEYYRNILNAYNFGESLSDEHFNDLWDLLEYDYLCDIANSKNDNVEIENVIKKKSDSKCQLSLFEGMKDEDGFLIDIDDWTIIDIRIAKVQFNKKCFELIYYNGECENISYIMLINRSKYDANSLFYRACRNSINEDIIKVKQKYFIENSKNGLVRCQETNKLSTWDDLVIDHRQPNTFSIIVDRFKEINILDLDKIEYTTNERNQIIFKDIKLTSDFINYHKIKANLRIVRKECNLSRTGMGRLSKNSKDLKL